MSLAVALWTGLETLDMDEGQVDQETVAIIHIWFCRDIVLLTAESNHCLRVHAPKLYIW